LHPHQVFQVGVVYELCWLRVMMFVPDPCHPSYQRYSLRSNGAQRALLIVALGNCNVRWSRVQSERLTICAPFGIAVRVEEPSNRDCLSWFVCSGSKTPPPFRCKLMSWFVNASDIFAPAMLVPGFSIICLFRYTHT